MGVGQPLQHSRASAQLGWRWSHDPRWNFKAIKLRFNLLWSALSAKVAPMLKTSWSKRNKWLSDSEAADWWASSVIHHICNSHKELMTWASQINGLQCPKVEALFHPHVLLSLFLPPPLSSVQCLICSQPGTGPSRLLIMIAWEKQDTHFSVVTKY